jgi:hypothetical protein
MDPEKVEQHAVLQGTKEHAQPQDLQRVTGSQGLKEVVLQNQPLEMSLY